MAADRGTFGKLGFILAAVGSAIGLGNIWKFPYITYANEGGTFVLVYLAAIVLIGGPIMVAEIVVGRRTQLSPIAAFTRLRDEEGTSGFWRVAGALGVVTAFVLLSYYAMIAGWTVFYIGKCLTWSLSGFPTDSTAVATEFGAFLGDGGMQLVFQGLFMVITTLVVILGIKAGIERVTRILMPCLGVMLVLLAANSFFQPGFSDAIRFLFSVGPIDADGVLEAVGHSFFTLSLGMGAMITYGSYMERGASIPRSAIAICILDTLVAILACIIMFSIIFSVPAGERDATFSQSATILFTTLPQMFYAMPFGRFLAPFFYTLVGFAALTSTISLLEVAVSYFIDSRGWGRKKAALIVGASIFALGVPAALSLGASSWFSNFEIPGVPSGPGFFSLYDYTVSNWFLPVGGLLIAIFVGWILSSGVSRREIDIGHGRFRLHAVWLWFLRVFAPAAIIWILIAVISGRTFN